MDEREMFNVWIERHARGSLNDEATAAISDVVKAVTDLEKKGSVVIEVIIEPAGSGGRSVAVGGRVVAKPPQPSPQLGVYYPDERGSLHRDDPFQRSLPGTTTAEQPPVVQVDVADTEPRRLDDEEDA